MSFPSMPHFTLSARPLRTLNVMRLPLLSDYVHNAITDIVSAFLAPNAFTLDVSRLIMVSLLAYSSIVHFVPD